MKDGQTQGTGAPQQNTNPEPVKERSRKYLIGAVLLAIVLAAGGWVVWTKFIKTGPTAVASQDKPPPPAETIKSEMVYASDRAASGDYSKAIDGYIGAASTAYNDSDYEKAKIILRDCIKTIPDEHITWSVYFTMAAVAKAQNDMVLEKSSLEKSVSKTQPDNPKVDKPDSGTLEYMKKRIMEL